MKNLIVFILLLASVLPLKGQVNSPYSRYGVGDPSYSYSARRAGMGSLGTAVDDNTFISMLNPAAWHSINLTRIELSSYFDGNFISSSSNKNFYSGGYFSGFTFAFPVSKPYGIAVAMGLIPLTKVAYQSKVSSYDPITQAENYASTYSGDGGISKIFLGTSYTLPFDFSLGASLDYNFGTLNYSSKLEFPDHSNANSSFKMEYRVKGLGGTFGLISSNLNESILKSDALQDLRLGASFSFSTNVTADTSFTKYGTYVSDTLSQGIAPMQLPPRLTVGFAARVNPRTQVFVDFLHQNWASLSISGFKNGDMQNVSRLSFGVEYKNSTQSYTISDLIIWRAGLSFGNSPYKINGTSINEYEASAGVSLPFSRENYLDLSLQFISRGTNTTGLLKENILRLGATLSLGELWFVRQDY